MAIPIQNRASDWSRTQFEILQDHLQACSHAEYARILDVLRPAAQTTLLILASSIPAMSEGSTWLNGPEWIDVMDPWIKEGEPALQDARPYIKPVIGQIISELMDYFSAGPATESEDVDYQELLTHFTHFALSRR